MLSLNECKRILKCENETTNLNDEEILLLRNWLYHMADIAIDSLIESDLELKSKEQKK